MWMYGCNAASNLGVQVDQLITHVIVLKATFYISLVTLRQCRVQSLCYFQRCCVIFSRCVTVHTRPSVRQQCFTLTNFKLTRTRS